MAPHSDKGRFMRNPFVKFISHSASYMYATSYCFCSVCTRVPCYVRFFLTLLALASQRFEYIVLSILCYFLPDVKLLTDTKHHWEVIFRKPYLV